MITLPRLALLLTACTTVALHGAEAAATKKPQPAPVAAKPAAKAAPAPAKPAAVKPAPVVADKKPAPAAPKSEPKAAQAAPKATALARSASGKNPKQAVAVEPAKPSGWRVRGGAQWRQLGNTTWRTGSLAAQSGLPWLAGPAVSLSGGASVTNDLGDHTYDDGFNNVDSSGLSGTTWNWGYNNAGQLVGNDLTFHSATGGGSFSQSTFTSSSTQRASQWDDDLESAGGFAEVETPDLFVYGPVHVTATLGYSFAQGDSNHGTAGVFSMTQGNLISTQVFSVTDTYDVTGIVVPIAPYAGSFAGPGAVIPNGPYKRETSNGASSSSVQSVALLSSVQEGLRMNLHTVSLGPKFSAQFQRVRAGLSLGLALNIANWDASYDETVRSSSSIIGRFHQSNTGTDVLPGFYLEASADVTLTQRWSLFVAGRYDWSDSLHAEAGPSSFEFTPGGWSILAGVTFVF